MLSTLDLFSGAGGLHMAAGRTGHFRAVAFSEVEKFPSKVLALRWPTIPNIGDITKVSEFPAVDVIMGGFPCQDISVGSHTGTGLVGARSGLWFHMLRAIEQTAPKGMLIENSDQLAKKGLDVVLQGIAALGYDAEWYTFAASSIGAPHRRKRLCVIAYRQRERRGGLVESFRLVKSGQWNFSGKEDLPEIYNSPYVPGPRWPQPLLRRMDDGLADRTHRLRAIGNGVVVPAFEQFCNLLWWRLYERGLYQP